MDGEVEVDETYIGGKAKNMHVGKRQEMRERGFPKTAVMGFRERDGEVRTMVIPDNTKETLQANWNLLDRTYHRTYIIMSPQHQDRYLAEQDFRYNPRTQKDGERFQQALSMTTGKRLTYKELTESHLVHLDILSAGHSETFQARFDPTRVSSVPMQSIEGRYWPYCLTNESYFQRIVASNVFSDFGDGEFFFLKWIKAWIRPKKTTGGHRCRGGLGER